MKIRLIEKPFFETDPSGPLTGETDVIFLLDSSRGVSPEDFGLQKEFVKSMAYNFNTSPNGPRASAARYGGQAITIVEFTDRDFVERVNRAAAVSTPRRIDGALEYAAQMFRRTGRKGSKLVILLTAGKQSRAPDAKPLQRAVEPLRILGAQTYVVSVGREPSSGELSPVVEQPRDIFQVLISGELPNRGPTLAKQIQERTGKYL